MGNLKEKILGIPGENKDKNDKIVKRVMKIYEKRRRMKSANMNEFKNEKIISTTMKGQEYGWLRIVKVQVDAEERKKDKENKWTIEEAAFDRLMDHNTKK